MALTTKLAGSYSDPNKIVRREHFATSVAGATTEGAKFRSFQKFKLKAVRAVVVTAGTATTHGYDVYNGTTSIGTIALSTSTAGSSAESGLLNASVASLGQISVKSLADATGVAHILYEYEVDQDAVNTL